MIKTYLFDSSIFIHHFRRDSAATALIIKAAKSELIGVISALTRYEVFKGNITEGHKLKNAAIIQPFKVYPVTKEIADRAARLYVGIPKTLKTDKIDKNRISIDVLIAATAEYYKWDIYTNNVKHFEILNLSVKILTP